ncbi:hypothetical protein ACFXOL_24355 [Streptomyces californicus]|uniref:hypothetical protein n=1 Tax=Streptomyces californicus TaxID=67351 RepID=UPI003666EBFF
MNDRLTSAHEQELRDLDPAEHPDIAALLRRVDAQRRVAGNKRAKIQRQRNQIAKAPMVVARLRARVAELQAELEKLRDQSA